MFQHPGFPDLYEPVVDALKVSKIPFCRCCTGSEEGFAVFNGYSDCLHLIIIIITSGQRTLTRGHFAYCVVIEDQYCYWRWNYLVCCPVLKDLNDPFHYVHHSRDSQCSVVRQTTPKTCPFSWRDRELCLLHGCLGPRELACEMASRSILVSDIDIFVLKGDVKLQLNNSWSIQPFLQGSRTWPTDRPLCSICSNRLH